MRAQSLKAFEDEAAGSVHSMATPSADMGAISGVHDRVPRIDSFRPPSKTQLYRSQRGVVQQIVLRKRGLLIFSMQRGGFVFYTDDLEGGALQS